MVIKSNERRLHTGDNDWVLFACRTGFYHGEVGTKPVLTVLSDYRVVLRGGFRIAETGTSGKVSGTNVTMFALR